MNKINQNDSIKVSKKRKPYTNILSDTLRDKNISLRAIGLLCHILSHDREKYDVSVKGLMSTVKDGRVSIESAISELISNGYCQKIEKPRVSGRFDGYLFTFSDNKCDLEQSEPLSIHQHGLTAHGSTSTVSPHTVPPARSISTKVISIESNTKEVISNESIIKEEKDLKPDFVGQEEISPEESAKISLESKYRSYLEMCNNELAIDGKKRRYKPDGKTKRQFFAMLESGYVGTDFITAMRNARKEQRHIDSGFKWLTPEFFTRPDKLQLYSNVVEAHDPLAEKKAKWRRDTNNLIL